MRSHVSAATLEPAPHGEGGIEQAVAIGRDEGSEHLELRIVRVPAGAAGAREAGERDELLFVLSGRGRLELDGAVHALAPETAAFVAAGERYVLGAAAGDPLSLVSITVRPDAEQATGGDRQVTVALSEQEARRATAEREFRLLFGPDRRCGGATQFVGVAPPGRAPDHYHLYDELIYVLDGEGVLHLGGEDTPVGPGSCIHLAPRQVHCLENSGDGGLKLVAVFRPALSPDEAYYPDGTRAEVS